MWVFMFVCGQSQVSVSVQVCLWVFKCVCECSSVSVGVHDMFNL